jgi:transcriptional adapter 1
MSTATIELSSTRRKLFDVLGDNQQQYLDHIRNWFRKRCTKEEFDSAARKLLTPESVHLHNQFLLAVLNKCQTLVNISPCPPLAKLEPNSSIPELLSPSKFDVPDRLKKGKIKRKTKTNRASLEHRFQPVSVPNCAPTVPVPSSLAPEERTARHCVRDSVLPDISLVHGRLLVAAWEEGLEGVEVRLPVSLLTPP